MARQHAADPAHSAAALSPPAPHHTPHPAQPHSTPPNVSVDRSNPFGTPMPMPAERPEPTFPDDSYNPLFRSQSLFSSHYNPFVSPPPAACRSAPASLTTTHARHHTLTTTPRGGRTPASERRDTARGGNKDGSSPSSSSSHRRWTATVWRLASRLSAQRRLLSREIGIRGACER